MAEEEQQNPVETLNPILRPFVENKTEYPQYWTLPKEGEPPGSLEKESDTPLIQKQREVFEHYQAQAATSFNRSDFLPPVTDDNAPLRDVTNILVGGEMSAMGMKWDSEGFNWNWDQFKQNWSEHPVLNTIAVTAWALPATVSGVNKFSRAGKYSGISDDTIVKYGLADTVEDAATMDDKYKQVVRGHIYQIERGRHLDEVMSQPPLPDAPLSEKLAWRKDQVEWLFRKNFSNTLADHLNPKLAAEEGEQLVKRIQTYMDSDNFNKHLADLPDAARGPAIFRAIHNPAEMPSLNPKEQAWARTFKADLQEFQKQALDEGLIDEDTYAKIGDVWLPTLREGTPVGESGVLITTKGISGKGSKAKLTTQYLPRTSSKSLLERSTSPEDVSNILRQQEAVGLLREGKNSNAMRVLKGEKFEEARGLIKEGKSDEAIKLLSKERAINASPEAMTVNGLLQQKLLLENFRYVRDIAMNPSLIKRKAEVEAMGAASKKAWVSLDSLENSNIIRRMVGKKMGKNGAVDELGYVRKDLFDSLADMHGEVQRPGLFSGMLEILTALHKTVKTAGNPYTHGQNFLGNAVMMWQAGWSPLEPENVKTISTALKGYRKWRTEQKAGTFSTASDLGKLVGKNGKTIDIAEELADPVTRSVILETTHLNVEGLESLQRMYDNATDAQALQKGLIKLIQKGSNITGLDKAANAYMAVDDVSKLSYFLGMRQKGLSRTAAALEVSRRLPMYSHIGKTLKDQRRWLLPWISFPAEMIRITKNNLMDNPIRTMMLLHAHKGAQAMMYPFMDEMSAENIGELKEQLPTYGQRPGRTVMTPFKDSNDRLRSISLDWLPHTSFYPSTSAKEASLIEKLPVGLNDPMPILGAITQIMTGKDQWGNEVALDPENPVQDFAKTMAQSMVNFISPPLVEKYLNNPRTPYPMYRIWQDSGVNIDPATGVPGDILFDGFVNNFSSFGKMYAASPEQAMANKGFYDDSINKYQAKLSKTWRTLMRNGEYDRATSVLEDIERVFSIKYKDPATAQKKSDEWLMRQEGTLRQHPQLMSFTREQLLGMIQERTDASGAARTKAQAEMIAAARKEIAIRGHKSKKKPGNYEIKEIGGAGPKEIGEY